MHIYEVNTKRKRTHLHPKCNESSQNSQVLILLSLFVFRAKDISQEEVPREGSNKTSRGSRDETSRVNGTKKNNKSRGQLTFVTAK